MNRFRIHSWVRCLALLVGFALAGCSGVGQSGGTPDTTAPSVSVTAPAPGASVSGTVLVTATATDNEGVAGVQFRVDGANTGLEDSMAPYSYSLDTTALSNGNHSVAAVARDTSGNAATSAAVSFSANNVPSDTTAPSVSITSPTGGSVSGTIQVTANASDNVGVVGVQFRLDGASLGAEDTVAPYSMSWSTTGTANGSHRLSAVARDAAGNTGTSAEVAVTVSNGSSANPDSFDTHHDSIPNFAKNPTIESVQDGAWSSPSTWTPARLPGSADIVLVKHAVTYNLTTGDAAVIGVAAGALLRFEPTTNTQLRVGTLLVMPSGTLEVGTTSSPIPAHLTAEIFIRNTPLNTALDPKQYGTGLLSINGTVNVHGAAMTPTFVRLARAPRVGDASFVLEQPVSGWRVGDRLVVPDSRQVLTESGTGSRLTYTQVEERSIQSISADGRTIAFSPALSFSHPGTTDEDGNGTPDYLPHVANVTRNILIRSENRAGTRGHILLTGRSAVDIRYASLEGLGRTTFHDLNTTTNHIGRYSLHMHHLIGPFPALDPQYQFRLVGNAIYEDSPTTPPQKWGITIHNSHYGLVKDNVVYNVGGAGIVTEDGSESYNVIDHNFVARVSGNGGRDEHFDSTRGIAREGVGFWFRGPNNFVRNNVAANMGENGNDVEASYGFKHNFVYLGNLRIPNFRGADTFVDGEYTSRNGNAMALLEFGSNEMYGQIQGLTIWWLCSVDFTAQNCSRSILRDIVIWHTSRYAYYGYPGSNYVFDNVKVYGDPAIASGNNFEFKSIFFYGDYGTKDHTVRNSYFYNTVGLTPPYFRDGSLRVDNSYFKTLGGIIHRKSGAPGSCPNCDLPDPDTTVTNNRAVAVSGKPLRSISMDYTTHNGAGDPANRDRLFVCHHNGVSGDSFEVFFPQQGNAPCTSTRPDIADGYVCVTPAAATACSAAPTVGAASTPTRVSPNENAACRSGRNPTAASAGKDPSGKF